MFASSQLADLDCCVWAFLPRADCYAAGTAVWLLLVARVMGFVRRGDGWRAGGMKDRIGADTNISAHNCAPNSASACPCAPALLAFLGLSSTLGQVVRFCCVWLVDRGPLYRSRQICGAFSASSVSVWRCTYASLAIDAPILTPQIPRVDVQDSAPWRFSRLLPTRPRTTLRFFPSLGSPPWQ